MFPGGGLHEALAAFFVKMLGHGGYTLISLGRGLLFPLFYLFPHLFPSAVMESGNRGSRWA